MTCNLRLLLLALASAIAVGAPAHAADLAAQSAAASDHGRFTTARQLARQAVAETPASGAAHVALARAALGEGDGITAEAEVARATENGVAPTRTRHLLAHARLLQGDATRALAIAKTADAADWVYGLRIQAFALAAMGNPGAANDVLALAIARAPRDAALWADVGRFRQGVGDVAGAIAAADSAVALDRGNVAALLLRARLVRDQFGLVASLPWFETALKYDPASYAVLIDYAATLGDAGRATDMLAATRRALAVRPGDPQAMYLLAVLAARAGKVDLARDLLDRTGGALDGQPGPLLLGATLDLEAGDSEQAVVKLRNLIGLQPLNVRARQLLAVALLRSDAARDALDVLRPIALRGDADAYTLTLSARAFERIGDRANAAQLLDRAAHPGLGAADVFGPDGSVPALAATAQGDPTGEPSTAIPLIRALIANGDTAGALQRAQAVADANRGAPGGAILLGDTLMLLRRPADAAVAYARAATMMFDEPTLLRLAEAREAAGDRAGAADAIALFHTQNPRNLAVLRLIARGQVASGDFAAAVDTLEQVRARTGNRDAALLADLAVAYGGAGNVATAQSFAAAAYRLAPANAMTADAYGTALLAAGDAGGAVQLLQKAAVLAPDNASVRAHLAQAYARRG
ncbi:tetratricopeptide repeat protein [Sphingomonas donggukensis]|uniref:Tetratricopeptide repeat protein n=1 Tax=Sphingomonas donggukensis TaxID=2949093 RepID=A0ABY4TZM9_9SPHN|nr:tetratricopeptide repeat protein [Sphingomonas donggukensis]URW75778.1 tetratricopeptide repeat protein [Sphingomonas donggukensis]